MLAHRGSTSLVCTVAPRSTHLPETRTPVAKRQLDEQTRNAVLRLGRLGTCGGGDGQTFCGIQFAQMLACGEMQLQPQQYLIKVNMNAGAVDKAVPGGLSSPISAPFWCHDMTYQIRQKTGGGFPATVFSKEAENNYAMNSGIDAQIRVIGNAPPWLFNGGSKSPIETLCRWVHDTALSFYSLRKDFLLSFPQELKVDLTPTEVLPDPQTEVIIALNGLTLGFNGICLSAADARRVMRDDFDMDGCFSSCALPGGYGGDGIGYGGLPPWPRIPPSRDRRKKASRSTIVIARLRADAVMTSAA